MGQSRGRQSLEAVVCWSRGRQRLVAVVGWSRGRQRLVAVVGWSRGRQRLVGQNKLVEGSSKGQTKVGGERGVL